MTMEKEIWVLTYLLWDEGSKRTFPEVHTYCFESEEMARTYAGELNKKHRAEAPAYHVHKTWLQEAPRP